MKRFFSPTKGGATLQRRMQEQQQLQNGAMATQVQTALQPGATPASQPGAAPTPENASAPQPGATPAQGMGGKGRRRAMRMAAKGANRPMGNLMQPHATPLNQPAPGQFGAGVAENQQPNIM